MIQHGPQRMSNLRIAAPGGIAWRFGSASMPSGLEPHRASSLETSRVPGPEMVPLWWSLPEPQWWRFLEEFFRVKSGKFTVSLSCLMLFLWSKRNFRMLWTGLWRGGSLQVESESGSLPNVFGTWTNWNSILTKVSSGKFRPKERHAARVFLLPGLQVI